MDRDQDERYLLGHGEEEWDRLNEQHLTWRHTLLDPLPRYRPLPADGSGLRVLEAGCGNGALLADLADYAGPEGTAVGVELDPAAAGRARRANAERPWVEIREGDLLELDSLLGNVTFDLVVSRWVLSFLSRPEAAVEQLAHRLAPGGVLVVQDYDYDGLRVYPGDPLFEKLFNIMPEAYRQRGGDAWIACRLPALFEGSGLELLAVDPHCQAGPPSSPVFRWVERFFLQHDHTLVEGGLLTAEERQGLRAAWRGARETPGTVLFSPLVVNVVGRRPES